MVIPPTHISFFFCHLQPAVYSILERSNNECSKAYSNNNEELRNELKVYISIHRACTHLQESLKVLIPLPPILYKNMAKFLFTKTMKYQVLHSVYWSLFCTWLTQKLKMIPFEYKSKSICCTQGNSLTA